MTEVVRVPTAPGSQGFAPEPASPSQPIGADPSRDWLMADTNRRGAQLRPGDWVSDWKAGEYPYGKLARCPFCEMVQVYTELWFNGLRSSPSYSVGCGDCGAKGPASQGHCKEDHYGACIDAVDGWNAGRDSDESGEAGETAGLDPKGDSAGLQGIAPTPSVGSETATDAAKREVL